MQTPFQFLGYSDECSPYMWLCGLNINIIIKGGNMRRARREPRPIGRIFFSDENMKYNIFIVAIKYTHEIHSSLIGCHWYTHATEFSTKPNSSPNRTGEKHINTWRVVHFVFIFIFPTVRKCALAPMYNNYKLLSLTSFCFWFETYNEHIRMYITYYSSEKYRCN